MKLHQLDLLTLLISLFILSACQNPDSIGLEVDPSNAINGNLIDTVTITSSTVREDSLATNSLAAYPIGNLTDPVFGYTTSSIAASLTLPGSSLTFGTAPVLDSAVLVLKYSDEYFGDPNALHKFEVHSLLESLKAGTPYYNTFNPDFNPTIIGSKLARVSIKDSVLIKEIITGKPDIEKKVAPQIRIPIDSTYITNNFFKANAGNFKDNAAFQTFIRGLYLTVNKNESTGQGGITLLDLSSGGSKLELYYKSPKGTAIDTTVTSFVLQNTSSQIAAAFSHDYSGTEIESQLANPGMIYNYNFIQPMAGVKTKIKFPYIKKLNEIGNIVINKAELVISVEDNMGIFAPAPRIFLYTTDIASQKQLVPDVSDRDSRALSDNDFGGFYDMAKKRYTFNLTSYIQDLINGNLIQYDTYITAIDNSASRLNGTFPSGSTAARAIIGSGQSNLPNKMKINILYTKIN